MSHEPEKRTGTHPIAPREHLVQTREMRDAEIKRQAAKDVQRSIGAIRVVLREGLRTST